MHTAKVFQATRNYLFSEIICSKIISGCTIGFAKITCHEDLVFCELRIDRLGLLFHKHAFNIDE